MLRRADFHLERRLAPPLPFTVDMYQGLAGMILTALVLSAWASPVLAGPPPQPSARSRPVVAGVEVDRLEPDRLVIRGANFGVTSRPVVLLSKVALEVVTFSDQQIVARFPLDAPPARYRLQVVAHGTRPSTVFEVTLGHRPHPE